MQMFWQATTINFLSMAQSRGQQDKLPRLQSWKQSLNIKPPKQKAAAIVINQQQQRRDLMHDCTKLANYSAASPHKQTRLATVAPSNIWGEQHPNCIPQHATLVALQPLDKKYT
jgi:hypothetical protein